MYDHSLHRGRKHFCCYCLHVFITEEILKRHIKDCFKINDKQRIIMLKKGVVPENNAKQNPEESYTNKYQKHIACSYRYKLVCLDDKFSKPFKTYLGKDAFINSMIEESKYCNEVMRKYFNKELVMTKEDLKF